MCHLSETFRGYRARGQATVTLRCEGGEILTRRVTSRNSLGFVVRCSEAKSVRAVSSLEIPSGSVVKGRTPRMRRGISRADLGERARGRFGGVVVRHRDDDELGPRGLTRARREEERRGELSSSDR